MCYRFSSIDVLAVIPLIAPGEPNRRSFRMGSRRSEKDNAKHIINWLMPAHARQATRTSSREACYENMVV